MSAGLRSRVLAWVAADPDPATAAELLALLDRADRGDAAAGADLADRFSGELVFGTAGLRAALGGGPMRMNRAVVRRAAAGLGAWLTASIASTGVEPGRAPRVAVGRDARHGSADFAEDTAAVLTALGCEVMVLPRALPTPVVAFLLRREACDAGVMVTASHNPPQDNGYKVFLAGRLGEGSQIVGPADVEIAARIAAAGAADTIDLAPGWTVLDEDVVTAYCQRASTLATQNGPRDLSIVTTSLHGVGNPVLLDALRRAGFTDIHPVDAQSEPDPDFPTVAFPNPEEPGALDLATDLALRTGADLVIANDPDADRLAVAVPWDGGMRVLRGDEVGALLGEHLACRGVAPGAVFARSLVSSTLLDRIAVHHGLRCEVTLTGFKWIGRVPGLAYGYEEALGYCVDPAAVRDKDGVSAAVLVADLAARWRSQGRTLLDALADLHTRHGVHVGDQVSVRVDDLSVVDTLMASLRTDPPRRLGGADVVRIDDLADGVDGLPPTEGVRYRTATGDRVVVRPSGTEPKLKAYLEVVVEPAGAGPQALAIARTTAVERLAALRVDVAARVTLPR